MNIKEELIEDIKYLIAKYEEAGRDPFKMDLTFASGICRAAENTRIASTELIKGYIYDRCPIGYLYETPQSYLFFTKSFASGQFIYKKTIKPRIEFLNEMLHYFEALPEEKLLEETKVIPL